MRLLLLVAALLPILALSACKGACRSLADLQCECLPTKNERDICHFNNGLADTSQSPDAAEEETCQALLETCQCGNTSTAEGKQACGLAR